LIGAAVPAFAQDESSGEWAPPQMGKDGQFDWIELTSGEWLKGKFSYMYEDSVGFDSDVLGDLTIDWGDIQQIYFHHPVGVRLNDRSIHFGKVIVKSGTIYFPETKESASQSTVVSISPKTTREVDKWEIKGRLGLDFQSGNTNETRYTTTLAATRRTVSSRFHMDYLGNYTKTDGTESANNHRAGANYDFFFDERMFLRVVNGEYYSDRFQNIRNQVTIGSGIGYKIVDTKKFDWEVQVGPAYQYTEFSQVEAGTDRTVGSAAGIFSTHIDYDITSDLDFVLSYQGVLTDRDAGLYTQHVVTSLDYELNSIFDVFIMLQFDRVEEPTKKSDGTTPDKNDVTVSLGLGIDI
tara:strand:+ start:12675 stop:13727 length:1053 start_codon:yes stop_codon:yes gene_type:complete